MRSPFLTKSNGWDRGGEGVVRTNRVTPGAGACLAFEFGGKPRRGIFSGGGGLSRDSVGTVAGKTGWAGCTITVGVSTGRGDATAAG